MELQFITTLPMLAIENIESFTGMKEELRDSFIKELKKDLKYIENKKNFISVLLDNLIITKINKFIKILYTNNYNQYVYEIFTHWIDEIATDDDLINMFDYGTETFLNFVKNEIFIYYDLNDIFHENEYNEIFII